MLEGVSCREAANKRCERESTLVQRPSASLMQQQALSSLTRIEFRQLRVERHDSPQRCGSARASIHPSSGSQGRASAEVDLFVVASAGGRGVEAQQQPDRSMRPTPSSDWSHSTHGSTAKPSKGKQRSGMRGHVCEQSAQCREHRWNTPASPERTIGTAPMPFPPPMGTRKRSRCAGAFSPTGSRSIRGQQHHPCSHAHRRECIVMCSLSTIDQCG